MKPNTSTATIDADTAIETTGLRMVADPALTAMMMSNLYANPHAAPLRELVANGIDATVAAGRTDPVKVGLPSELSPILTVRDYGTGMTSEVLNTLYDTYGESSKRGTNDEHGQFGVGSKSPFAVSSTFTVSTICDGLKNVVSLSVVGGQHGEPVMSRMVVDAPTDDPDGTLVTIPTDHTVRWDSIARQQFEFLPEGRVTVDDESVGGRLDSDQVLWITDRSAIVMTPEVWSSSRRIADTRGVVCGGFLYRATDALTARYEWPQGLVLTADIGEVDPLPNRENLRDTDATAAFLDEHLTQAVAEHRRQSESMTLAECRSLTGSGRAVALEGGGRTKLSGMVREHGYTAGRMTAATLPLPSLVDRRFNLAAVIAVYGDQSTDLSRLKPGAAKAMDEIGADLVVATNDQSIHDAVGRSMRVDEFIAWAKPYTKKTGRTRSREWPVALPGHEKQEMTIAEMTESLGEYEKVFVVRRDWGISPEYCPVPIVYSMAKTVLSALPNAQTFDSDREARRVVSELAMASLTEADRRALWLRQQFRVRSFEDFAEKVDDPWLAEAAVLASEMSGAGALRRIRDDDCALAQDYPLLNIMQYGALDDYFDDIIEYVNMVYATKVKARRTDKAS